MPKVFISKELKNTHKIAENILTKALRKKRTSAFVMALVGELGSGKTMFVQGAAKAFGIKEKIKSPTFIILRRHKIPNSKYLYHLDLYRIHNAKEVLNLGWEEIISDPDNIVLVEWADKIKKILPKDAVQINFKHKGKNKREIKISQINH